MTGSAGGAAKRPAPTPGGVRAVIVDDEPAARDVIRTFLEEEDQMEVVGEAGNGRDALTLVRTARPDLLFLDVQMPDLDGFGVLEALGDDVPPGVVFVTAHDEHALRAFDVHALDYVLKPFGRPRFKAAVARALRRLRGEEALRLQETLRSVMEGLRVDRGEAGDVRAAGHEAAAGGRTNDLEGRPGPAGGGTTVEGGAGAGARPERLGVRLGSRTILVDVADIDWVEADGDYARLHVGEKVHLVSRRMHALEELLDPATFLRIHRSAIVNLGGVRELIRDPDGGGTAILRDGVRLRVSRSRWDVLERALGLGS